MWEPVCFPYQWEKDEHLSPGMIDTMDGASSVIRVDYWDNNNNNKNNNNNNSNINILSLSA